MKTTYGILFFFTVMVFPESVKSQDSLLHYIAIGIEKNATVNQRFYEYKAAVEKARQAVALNDPQLDAGILLEPMELLMGREVAEFQIMQMFPWFGTLRAAKDEMSLMANAKYESFRDSKLTAAFNIQKTWFELYKTTQQILIAEDNMKIIKSIERLSITRYKTVSSGRSSGNVESRGTSLQNGQSSGEMDGMGSGTDNNITVSSGQQSMEPESMGNTGSSFGLQDVYRIQIEIGDLENNIAYLETQKNVLLARFNGYLNRQPDSPVVLPDSLPQSIQFFDVKRDSMLQSNPMLNMLRLEKQSLEARKNMVTRMGYPMVGLGINYTVIQKAAMLDNEMNGRDMIMPMVSATLPVYRHKYKAMRKESDYLILAGQSSIDAMTRELELEYEQALKLYDDAQRRKKIYDEQWKISKKSLDIMLRKLSTSGSDLTDILRFRQQVLDFGYRYTEAIVDLNTSTALLNRLAGGIQ